MHVPPRRPGSPGPRGVILGRAAFARISAVEGIELTPEMRETMERFDHDGVDAEDRRSQIVARFAQPGR